MLSRPSPVRRQPQGRPCGLGYWREARGRGLFKTSPSPEPASAARTPPAKILTGGEGTRRESLRIKKQGRTAATDWYCIPCNPRQILRKTFPPQGTPTNAFKEPDNISRCNAASIKCREKPISWARHRECTPTSAFKKFNEINYCNIISTNCRQMPYETSFWAQHRGTCADTPPFKPPPPFIDPYESLGRRRGGVWGGEEEPFSRKVPPPLPNLLPPTAPPPSAPPQARDGGGGTR